PRGCTDPQGGGKGMPAGGVAAKGNCTPGTHVPDVQSAPANCTPCCSCNRRAVAPVRDQATGQGGRHQLHTWSARTRCAVGPGRAQANRPAEESSPSTPGAAT